MAVAFSKQKAPMSPASSRTPRGAGPGRVILVPTLLLLAVAAVGIPYYVCSSADRLRHPLHAWFRPSGYIGQTAGILTFVGFLFMWLFPMRKRMRRAAWAGPVPKWLDVHIGVGLMLPLVGAIHAAFRFGGVIGLGYIAMLIVCASGVVGRYLYVRIPRSRSGVELGLGEVAAQQRALIGELSEASGISVMDLQEILQVKSTSTHVGVWAAFVQMVRDDLARGQAVRRLRSRIKAGGGRVEPGRLHDTMTLARRQMSLAQQARLLNATQSLFKHWHAAHLPVAITAVIAVTIHVVVVIAMGATWF
ncbi:MAG TPA: hypothetical protein VJS69_06305 [Candidatus Krumholzibacteria bacterium]|nr:hypothetical protein [Candidatus Krumholzibacteria bacterium]